MRNARPAVVLAGCIICAVAGCSAVRPTFSTWASLGERPWKSSPVAMESLPPLGAFPWAGTVSHHLLADALLNRWFAELAQRRSVEVFFILSPSHWGLSTLTYSLTDGSWRVPAGRVESDVAKVTGIARTLGVALESSVFEGEHGVSTLMPYIARYFPRAKVVAMAYRGEPPLDQPMASRLAQALAPAFDAEGKRRNFLLISADFAHHGNAAGTTMKDGRTRRFFDSPSLDTWIFAGCDNRPGMYALAHLLGSTTRCSVQFHSDSLQLSGHEPNDITSYFFTMFWDPVSYKKEPSRGQRASACTRSLTLS